MSEHQLHQADLMIKYCSATTTFIRGFYTSREPPNALKHISISEIFMKLFTPFSIPKPEMTELCRIQKAAKKKANNRFKLFQPST